jgi:hypothetical protein
MIDLRCGVYCFKVAISRASVRVHSGRKRRFSCDLDATSQQNQTSRRGRRIIQS